MNKRAFANHITKWLTDYVDAIPMDGFILGVSGGVDSALIASLCARTSKKTLLLSMPIHQSPSELLRAEKQITLLEASFKNVESLKIDLTSTFQELVRQFPIDVQNDTLSTANVRARLRMTSLYGIGQTNKLLVTGTGNKIEDRGIGFFTKYGDGGVDINPIGDLLKSEVYALAEYLGVIDEILVAKPTDGLWGDNRNDEDQIGATYDELEWAMAYEEGNKQEKLSPREEEVLTIYRKMNRINQHKFNAIPVCDLSELR